MDKVSCGNRLVCCFDSGIGGLRLFAECVKQRHDCDFIYFADNFNVPYGSLKGEEILSLADKKFSLMARLNPAAAVVACNTVTAGCIEFLREKYSFPIIGIQPAVKPAALNSERCVVLCTPATANSSALGNLIEKFGRGRTRALACDGLAAYIENNIFNMENKEVEKLLPAAECDGVVLGCTHYTYAADIISAHYKCPVYDGIEGTAARLSKILGIPDHRNLTPRKVAFSGGNVKLNRSVFEFLIKTFPNQI